MINFLLQLFRRDDCPPSSISVELLPRVANRFADFMESLYTENDFLTLDDHSSVLKFLNEKYSTVIAREKNNVPEGKKPGLLIASENYRGYFMLLPDRNNPKGYFTYLFSPDNLLFNNNGYIIYAEWTAAHVTGTAPPRKRRYENI